MTTKQNPGRPESVNPTDATQANPAVDKRSKDAGSTPVTSDNVNAKPQVVEVPSLEEQKEALPMPEQETDSVYLYFPSAVEVDGINYGAGEVKVAKADVAKIQKAVKGVTEIEDIRNVHLGAKPMPKDLNGPDYV